MSETDMDYGGLDLICNQVKVGATAPGQAGTVLSGAEIAVLDGVTAGTVTASKAVVVDSNKDAATFRHVTLSGNLVIGATTLSETDLAKVDAVTNGTVTASKAVVVDSNKDIATLRHVTLSGNLVSGATTLDETDLAKIDGITNGTAIASKAVVTDTNIRVAGLAGVTSSVAGVVAGFLPTAVQQALSGAGAVNLTTYYTAVTNTGADALTLADSTVLGQLKKVQMIVDPGTDSTLTFNTNATVVFADVGDYVVLIWNGSDWLPIELGNDADGATAPAYTPAS